MKWLEDNHVTFRGATEPRPINETINCLLGAAVMAHGLESTGALSKLLFDSMQITDNAAMSPRSRLQAAIQAVVKNRYDELFSCDTCFLNKPNEMHDTRIQATLRLDGVVIGCAVAKRKKDAIAAASIEALENPELQELLDALDNTRSNDG